MEISKIKKALIEQKRINLSGNLYHKTQLDFAYNTNHIEGSTITSDETASIYDTGTILTNSDKVIVLKDATETKNHFTLFKYMLDTIEEDLTEEMIKKFHFILKDGTLTDSEKEWFNVGDYKKKKNFVGNITTSLPSEVSKDMKKLMDWYNSLTEKKLEDYADLILDTHAEVNDVILEVADGHKMNHVGTINGNVIAQMLTAETYRYLTENGYECPVLLSANLKGADVHNRRLSDKYAGRWNS